MDQIRIGAFIAQLRREKGWTQEELGERLGVTNKTVSRWETGSYMPGVEMLTLLGRELDVTLNELLEGRRLSEDDFRAAADEKLAHAMRRPGERLRRWMAQYWGFAAVVLVLCIFLGTAIFVDWQYRQAHPEDVRTEYATFIYRAGWPEVPEDDEKILYLAFHRGNYYIYTCRGEYLEWGSVTRDGDAIQLDDGETTRLVIVKGKQIRDVDPRNGELITYEHLFEYSVSIGHFPGDPNYIEQP